MNNVLNEYDLFLDLKELACSYFSYEPVLSEFKVLEGVNYFGTQKITCEVNEIGKVPQKIVFNVSIDEGF